MEAFTEYAAILVPVVILEVALAITALVHVLRHPNYKFGNRIVWVLVVCLIQIFGPIVYFVAGRGEE